MRNWLCVLFGHKYYSWLWGLNTDIHCERCGKLIYKRIPPPPLKTEFKQPLKSI